MISSKTVYISIVCHDTECICVLIDVVVEGEGYLFVDCCDYDDWDAVVGVVGYVDAVGGGVVVGVG